MAAWSDPEYERILATLPRCEKCNAVMRPKTSECFYCKRGLIKQDIRILSP